MPPTKSHVGTKAMDEAQRERVRGETPTRFRTISILPSDNTKRDRSLPSRAKKSRFPAPKRRSRSKRGPAAAALDVEDALVGPRVLLRLKPSKLKEFIREKLVTAREFGC